MALSAMAAEMGGEGLEKGVAGVGYWTMRSLPLAGGPRVAKGGRRRIHALSELM
jgi:hypothetical protein